MLLSVGEKTNILFAKPEGCFFEIDESGPIMFFNYIRPHKSEVDSFKPGSGAEFGLACLNGVLFILAKIGSMPWVDAPYDPHLSKVMPEAVEEELGYLLTLMLIDKYPGIVRGLRAVGLDHNFSVALRNEIQNAKSVPFDRNDYERAINDVYRHYSTEDLVEMSRARCVI